MLGILVKVIGIDVILSKATRDSCAVILDLDSRTFPIEMITVRKETIAVTLGSDVGHTIVKGRHIHFTECRDGISSSLADILRGYCQYIAADTETIRLVCKEHFFCTATYGNEGTGIVRLFPYDGNNGLTDVLSCNGSCEGELLRCCGNDSFELAVSDRQSLTANRYLLYVSTNKAVDIGLSTVNNGNG